MAESRDPVLGRDECEVADFFAEPVVGHRLYRIDRF
jgi:hypothetical protein